MKGVIKMYVSPFWAGVAATIIAEVFLILALGVWYENKTNKRK